VAFSIIVTSYQSPELLQECLRSIMKQVREGDEVVVADCSISTPDIPFSQVRLIHFPERRSVPQMRWAALRATSGELVAAVESRCIPQPAWLEKLAEAHRRFPDAPAIGGPVGLTPGSTTDDAQYFCEYGRFAPPVPSGPATEISGGNLSFKRAFLEEHQDLLDAGCWETLIHLRWLKQGLRLALCDARVRFVNGMSFGYILRQRIDYGRNYAAARSGPRYLYAAGSVVLPALLTWRLLRSLRGKGLTGRFWRCFIFVLLFNAAWSAGELCGYLFGPAKGERIY
jgi:glycosyltransferase involved in cell wall biosynthesis